MPNRIKPLGILMALALLAPALSGCIAISAGATIVGATVGLAGKAVTTTVGVVGDGVGAAGGAVFGDDENASVDPYAEDYERQPEY